MSARIAAALSVFCFSFYGAGVNAQTPAWNFVSSPDWFNRDVADLSGSTAGIPKAEGWDAGVSGGTNGVSPQMTLVYDFLVGEMSTFNPQVFVVSGDLINGRWFDDSALDMFDSDTRDRATAIDNAAEIYYGWYRHLFGRFGITSVLPVVGDHELGDDAWFSGTEKAQHVQTMRNAFGRNLVDPLSLPAEINGVNSRPVGTPFENSSYAYQHLNLLFISVDIFHQSDPTIDVDSLNGTITPEVVGPHLTWLETLLLAADQDSTIDHIIVQGHAPVLSPVRMQQSSGMILRDRELSPFWNALRQYGHQNSGKVRLYLSGEVHTVTASQDPASDIIQVVHGNPPWAVPGRSEDRTNYLVFTVHPDRLEIESRQALLSNDGSSIFWQPDDPQSEGPSGVQASTQVGTMVIDVTGTTTDVTASGDLALIDQVGLVTHFGFDQTTSAGNYSNTGSIGDDYYEGVGAGGVSNVAGQFGTAIDLDGSTGFVRSGRGSIIGGDSRTVSSWIRTTDSDKQTILSYGGNYSGANTRFNLQLKSGQLQLQMASGKTCSPDDSPALSDGAWHHVAIALTDAHNSRCADTLFYIDGVEYSPGANNSTEPFETVPWSDIRIGTDIRESYFFDGSIDDIAIWASPLTSAKVLSITSAGRHAALGYDALTMEKLFDLFDAGSGQTSIGDATWQNAAGIGGTPGDVVVQDGVLAIALDGAGNGVKSGIPWTVMALHPVSVMDVGARLKNAGRLIDESSDGSQDLSTSWGNDGKRSTAWFTLDLGSTQWVEEVRIAPRADRLYELEIYVGDELSGGQVTGVPVSICTPGTTGQQVPTELQSCPVPETTGRYVTVKLTNKTWFKVYGVEVWGA